MFEGMYSPQSAASVWEIESCVILERCLGPMIHRVVIDITNTHIRFRDLWQN